MSDSARHDENRARSDENPARVEEEQMHSETGDPGSDREHLQDLPPADVDDDQDVPEVTPAGRAGADSGAAPLVGVDDDDAAESTDRSSQNDIPGVGPRGAEHHEHDADEHSD